MKNPLIFRQLFDHETYTFTYLLADAKTKEAVIIDSVKENFERDSQLIEELGLKLLYTLDTHVHADHVTASGKLRERFHSKSVIGEGSKVECSDLLLKDGDTLQFGTFTIKALSTPGHTDSCTSYVVDDMVFTGDTLFIRGSGRTDFQQGSPEKLFKSVHEKLFSLPDATRVFPGHDYRGLSESTIGEEKRLNPRLKLGTSLAQFKKTMSELRLANPKRIHEALPANLSCGREA